MRTADLEAMHEITLALRWPHRPGDLAFMLRTGDGIVAVDATGACRGGIFWNADPGTAVLSPVLMPPGEGEDEALATMLLKGAARRLAGRGLVTHVRPLAQPRLERLGFASSGTVEACEGIAAPVPPLALEPGLRIRPLGQADLPALIRCDREAAAIARPAMMQALLETADGLAVDRDGVLAGYAFCRRAGRRWAIGPVAAPSQQAAMALIAYRIGERAGQHVRIDLPGEAGLVEWLATLGLPRHRSFVTMLRPQPASPRRRRGATRSFAVCALAL